MTGIQVNEVVPVLEVGYGRYTSLVSLHAACHPHGEWCSEGSTDHSIGPERELILVLNVVSVLPWPPLGARHVLAGMETDPGVAQELVVQPILKL